MLDERNEEKDTNLSKYVMSMHAKAAAPQNQGHGVDASNAPINVATLKRYITYCRTKCSPVRTWLYNQRFLLNCAGVEVPFFERSRCSLPAQPVC